MAALLVLAPLVDAIVCLDDAHAEASIVVTDTDDQHGPLGHDDTISGTCHHGHTHMPAPFVSENQQERPLLARYGACRLTWRSDPDRSPAGLTLPERPPRS